MVNKCVLCEMSKVFPSFMNWRNVSFQFCFNSVSYDILVMNKKTNVGYNIEVKTTSSKTSSEKLYRVWHPGPTHTWIMSQKSETNVSDNLIYCFVQLHDLNTLPKFFLVQSKIVAKYVKDQHQLWLDKPRSKPISVEGSMRKFRIDVDDPNGYENNWSLLEK